MNRRIDIGVVGLVHLVDATTAHILQQSTAVGKTIDMYSHIENTFRPLEKCLNKFQKLSDIYSRNFPSRPPQVGARFMDLSKRGLIRKEILLHIKEELRLYRETGHYIYVDSYSEAMLNYAEAFEEITALGKMHIKKVKNEPHFRTLEFGNKKKGRF